MTRAMAAATYATYAGPRIPDPQSPIPTSTPAAPPMPQPFLPHLGTETKISAATAARSWIVRLTRLRFPSLRRRKYHSLRRRKYHSPRRRKCRIRRRRRCRSRRRRKCPSRRRRTCPSRRRRTCPSRRQRTCPSRRRRKCPSRPRRKCPPRRRRRYRRHRRRLSRRPPRRRCRLCSAQAGPTSTTTQLNVSNVPSGGTATTRPGSHGQRRVLFAPPAATPLERPLQTAKHARMVR